MKKKDASLPPGQLNRYSAQYRFYNTELIKHGPLSALAVGWNEFVQERMFSSISRILPEHDRKAPFTLLDIGCGLGDYVPFLEQEGYNRVDYNGIDIIPAMIVNAKRKFPGRHFFVRDFMDIGFRLTFDYLVCSGGLNIITYDSEEKHIQYIKRFIKKMYLLTRRGFAFNLLSSKGGDYLIPDRRFFLADPEYFHSFCHTLDERAEIDHSCYEFCFTISMIKQNTFH